MNDLLSVKKISSFENILSAYVMAGVDLHSAIDGGAGSGATAKSMLTYLDVNAHVYAFEPFPGNHRFFSGLDLQICLRPEALGNENKAMQFFVSSTVEAASEWGKCGMVGYSSLGKLVHKENSGHDDRGNHIWVDCVRADDVIPNDERIGFIKLDLQGGELNALEGMCKIVADASIMWVEYLGRDPLLLDFILDSGYIIFDTKYLILGRTDG